MRGIIDEGDLVRGVQLQRSMQDRLALCSDVRTVDAPLDAAIDEGSRELGVEDFARLLPLVSQIAARFMRRLPPSVQRDDLVAAGTVGLLQAVRDGRYSGEEMFVAYARIRIRGAMLDELRRSDWSPRRKKDAEQSAMSVVRIDDLGPNVEFAANDESPFDQLERKRNLRGLEAAMRTLPEREREIIRLRYFEMVPAKAIAVQLRLSEARISQLHARATARLQSVLEDPCADLAGRQAA